MKNGILLIIIAFTLMSCSKEDDSIEPALIGKWTWVASSGGLAGSTKTPQSTGEVRKLEISTDSIKKYTNGTLVFKTAYTVKTLDSEILQEQRQMLVQENGLRQIVNLNGPRLILREIVSTVIPVNI